MHAHLIGTTSYFNAGEDNNKTDQAFPTYEASLTGFCPSTSRTTIPTLSWSHPTTMISFRWRQTHKPEISASFRLMLEAVAPETTCRQGESKKTRDHQDLHQRKDSSRRIMEDYHTGKLQYQLERECCSVHIRES